MLNESQIRSVAKQENVTHFTTGIAAFRDSKLLVVRRSHDEDDLAGEWELPGGGVDDGETIQEGAIRELLEETNLKVREILGTFEGFDYSTPRKPKARQFNFRVLVEPGKIMLTEHDKYLWINQNDIAGLKTNKVMEECMFNAFQK